MAEGFLDMLRRHKQDLENALGGNPTNTPPPDKETPKEEKMSGEELDKKMADYKKKYPDSSPTDTTNKGFQKAGGK